MSKGKDYFSLHPLMASEKKKMLLKPALSTSCTNNMSGQVCEVPVYKKHPGTKEPRVQKIRKMDLLILQEKIRQLTLVITQLGNLKIAFPLKARSLRCEIEKQVNRAIRFVSQTVSW